MQPRNMKFTFVQINMKQVSYITFTNSLDLGLIGIKPFDTLMVFMKELFEIVDLKNSTDDKIKHEKLPIR